MKKMIPTLLTAMALTWMLPSVSAQTVTSGAWMFGGSAQFSSTKLKNSDGATTTLNLAPNFGLFIIDDLAAGINLSFMSTSFGGTSNSSFGLGPFVRYYLTDPIYVQGGVDLGLNDNSATTLGLSVGYSWFIDDALAIEPALFFSSVNYDGENADATIFGLSIGIRAFAGNY